MFECCTASGSREATASMEEHPRGPSFSGPSRSQNSNREHLDERLVALNSSCESDARNEAFFLSSSTHSAISSQLKLSSRESEITYLVLRSCSEKEIAERLHISVHTVHSHLERLYRKLQICNRCELVVRLFETYVTLQMGT